MLQHLILQAAIAQAAGQPQPPSALVQLVPFVLMIGVMYFLLFRPQSKQAKSHKQLLEGLKSGQEVITASGIYGKIYAITENVVTLEIANNVRIKIQKSQIAGSAAVNPTSVEKK